MGELPAGNNWHIDSTLHPYPNNSVSSAHGVKYTIAGHIYMNAQKSHFMARYLSSYAGKSRIFDYDGMDNDGHAVLKAGALKGLLTGPVDALKDIAPGFFLNAVVYRLEGGKPAQEFFRKQQIESSKKIGLHFDSTGTDDIPISFKAPD
jgi:hypothetical protein